MTFTRRTRHARLRIEALAAVVVLVHAGHAIAGDSLPREPSQLLLVGDSITAGIYFLSLDETSIRAQEEYFRSADQLDYEGPANLDSVYRRDVLAAANEFLAANP